MSVTFNLEQFDYAYEDGKKKATLKRENQIPKKEERGKKKVVGISKLNGKRINE